MKDEGRRTKDEGREMSYEACSAVRCPSSFVFLPSSASVPTDHLTSDVPHDCASMRLSMRKRSKEAQLCGFNCALHDAALRAHAADLRPTCRSPVGRTPPPSRQRYATHRCRRGTRWSRLPRATRRRGPSGGLATSGSARARCGCAPASRGSSSTASPCSSPSAAAIRRDGLAALGDWPRASGHGRHRRRGAVCRDGTSRLCTASVDPEEGVDAAARRIARQTPPAPACRRGVRPWGVRRRRALASTTALGGGASLAVHRLTSRW